MNKIFVTYATRGGSTAEVATRVAEVLRAAGANVDVKYVTAVHEVQGYDAVVAGSAIRMGHWLPEAVAFVQAHHEPLSHIPIAYFLVSGLLRNDTPETRPTRLPGGRGYRRDGWWGLLQFMQQQGYTDPAQAIAEASVRAILAGNDIVECPIEPDRLAAVVTALTTAVQTGRVSQERLPQR